MGQAPPYSSRAIDNKEELVVFTRTYPHGSICPHISGLSLGLSLIALLLSAPSLVWGASFSSATYRVVFESTWSPQTHPDPGFPGNAHFSPLIGGVHSTDVSFWTKGGLASAGIEAMAEVGATGSLSAEIQTAINDGDALTVIEGNGLGTSTGTVIIEQFPVNTNFPLVTLTSMIAPSPDWFIGVSGLSLLDEQGQWEQEVQVILFPYDAGTEEGNAYSTSNSSTSPQQPIQNLTGVAPFSSAPIGTFTFMLTSQEDVSIYAELERPRPGQVVAGGALIQGWAFGPADNPVSSVELFIDGELFDTIPFGSQRGDVADAFPQQSNALLSGFGISTNYGLFPPGPHTLTVRVTNQNGDEFSLTRQITVLQFGGFEFADVDLSGATVRLEAGEIVIEGAQVTDLLEGGQQTVTIRLDWASEAQGFVVTDMQ